MFQSKGRIFLVSLESVPTRYTSQWKDHLPKIIAERTGKEVIDIAPSNYHSESGSKAFLNFIDTNRFKSEQALLITQRFADDDVKDYDIFLFCDAWNPVIIQTRYMIELTGVQAEIHSIWHAGSYDPHDLLGQMMDKRWSFGFEQSLFNACDVNYFATDFHIDMFLKGLFPLTTAGHVNQRKAFIYGGKIVRTGFPMECVSDYIQPKVEKENLVVFPHRLSDEKNIELFRWIKKATDEYDYGFKCIICQDSNLSKEEYYSIMARAKIMFSANEQETLGLSALDAILSGCDIMVPDRLSYKEMYPERVKFNDRQHYLDIIGEIRQRINEYSIEDVEELCSTVIPEFFQGDRMYRRLAE